MSLITNYNNNGFKFELKENTFLNCKYYNGKQQIKYFKTLERQFFVKVLSEHGRKHFI